MSVESIHELLTDWALSRLSPEDHVYDLRKHTWVPFSGHRLLHQRQVEILELMRASAWQLFLNSPESPHDWELEGEWHEAAANTWIVPPDNDSDELLSGYLGQGEWTLYLAGSPLITVDTPNSFAMTSAELSGFTRSNGIAVFVQAFCDNADWRIALQPDLDPNASVA